MKQIRQTNLVHARDAIVVGVAREEAQIEGGVVALGDAHRAVVTHQLCVPVDVVRAALGVRAHEHGPLVYEISIYTKYTHTNIYKN